jgi:crotonobetainyl-CoA:carnitine CoA-transferase CaiB-like acyl-CoA transferase
VLPYSDRNWQDIWHLLDRGDLAADPRFASLASRTPHIVELQGLLAAELARHPTRWLFEHLKAAAIPVAPVNSIDDLFEDPHLAAVGMFALVPDGHSAQARYVRSPVRFSQSATELDVAPAPLLGQHSREVLLEAGLHDTEITALAAATSGPATASRDAAASGAAAG